MTSETLARPADAGLSLDPFARRLSGQSWFAAVGEPPTVGEHEEVLRYLGALGLPLAPLSGVAGWAEAKRVSRAPDWDPRWWEAEERERALLTARAE